MHKKMTLKRWQNLNQICFLIFMGWNFHISHLCNKPARSYLCFSVIWIVPVVQVAFLQDKKAAMPDPIPTDQLEHRLGTQTQQQCSENRRLNLEENDLMCVKFSWGRICTPCNVTLRNWDMTSISKFFPFNIWNINVCLALCLWFDSLVQIIWCSRNEGFKLPDHTRDSSAWLA